MASGGWRGGGASPDVAGGTIELGLCGTNSTITDSERGGGLGK